MNPDPVAEFRSAMHQAGLVYSGPIQGDGVLHRFNADGSKGNAEYYLLHLDDHPAGSFGSHRLGVEGSWSQKFNGSLPPKDLAELQRQWRAQEQKRQVEKLKAQGSAAVRAKTLLAAASPARSDHPYLIRKQVPALGNLRVGTDDYGRENCLLLPLTDADGAIHSLESIDPDGDKLFQRQARTAGLFFSLFERPDGPLIIAEGYATAASCHLATGWAAVAGMNCGNLLAVSQGLRKKLPDRPLLLAADNDRFNKDNPGLEKARAAAAEFKPALPIAVPEFSDEDTPSTDFNDLARLSGLGVVRQILEAACPAPLSFRCPEAILSLRLSPEDLLLGDHVLACGSLTVILAAGGVGKSRLALQLAAACCAQHPKFLAWDIHPRSKPLRWLIIQAENSTRRLQNDLRHIRDWLGPERWPLFSQNVHLLTPLTELDSQLDLDNPAVLLRLQKSIDLFLPDIVVFDALYNFSLRELRFGSDMAAAVSNCCRLAKYHNPNRTPILLHHALAGLSGASRSTGYDRSSFARDSKVIHQLARSVINITPISEDSSDQILISCGKCSDGKEFPSFASRLNLDTLLFECDPSIDVAQAASFLRNPNKRQPAIQPSRVRELCSIAGSSKIELVKAVRDDSGCTRESAYRFIRSAISSGQIKPGRDDTLFRA